MSIFLFAGILLFIAIYAGRIFHRVKLPAVTGYILIGFALGNIPYFSLHLSPYFVQLTNYVDEIALAVISFEIGMEFSLKTLQQIEKKIFIITIVQAIFTYCLILATFNVILKIPLPISMIIASIGIATAPDIIILVLREYNLKGKLAEYLEGIVTLDDLLTELTFIITIPVAEKIMHSYITGISPAILISKEIVFSILLGVGLGVLFAFIVNEFRKLRSLFSVTVGFILISIGISMWLNLHIIFVLLLTGIVFTNLSRDKTAVVNILSQIDAPLLIIFLIVNGSALSIKLLIASGILGIAFVLSRGIGKIVGTYISGFITKEPLCNKIGWALLPQSEISIYLAVITKNTVPMYGNTIFTVAMAGVIIFEIIGAPLLKYIITDK